MSEFSTAQKAQESLELIAFKKFKSTVEAVESACALQDGKLNKSLKKLLKENNSRTESEQLAVGDAKLGSLIRTKWNFHVCIRLRWQKLMRGIRAHIDSWLGEHKSELNAMNLAVAHSLGRYKLNSIQKRLTP
ncbi:hypothetical protein KIN20_016791 [Parelaphostrongylus tenuis]|uniref:Nucleolar protein 58/56 N-terminal domain-containing protein n=1 Tax=Parelaphostrongylus tenuis TaxID=148309 RepID=A0AAD5N5Q8_PARTN|nr:hypothetical protein KIN20_016791 [Parelaphostrongylus tenuis]